jgi:hypothetical protein
MTNFEKDMTSLRQAGVEGFDIFTKEELSFFKDKKCRVANHNKLLAGHLKEEYQIKTPEYFEQRLQEYIPKSEILLYELQKRFPVNSHYSTLKLGKVWVNFQKKHEFNPVHRHDGVLSMVVFIQIPYDLEKEDALFRANSNFTSRLQFQVIDNMGEISPVTCNVDKSYEGKILIFNARKFHCVYPFYTSNKYRITASGNFLFNLENYDKNKPAE